MMNDQAVLDVVAAASMEAVLWAKAKELDLVARDAKLGVWLVATPLGVVTCTTIAGLMAVLASTI